MEHGPERSRDAERAKETFSVVEYATPLIFQNLGKKAKMEMHAVLTNDFAAGECSSPSAKSLIEH